MVLTGWGVLIVPWPPSRRGASWLPSAVGPWHAAHFFAKISAPCLAVPLPGGSSFPSGPIAMSQAWISSLVGLRPMLYDGACAHAAVEAASAIMGTNELDRHIANAPVAVHFPGVNSVEITHVHGALQLKV